MPRGIKPKDPKRGYTKKKGHKTAYISIFFVFIFTIVFGVMIFFPQTSSRNIIYEVDLTVTGSLGKGITTPSFGVKSGQRVNVRISNYQSNDVTLKVNIQGGGNYWYKIVSGNFLFSKTAPDKSVYNVQFSVNTFYDIGGEVSFHVEIYLGG